MPVNLLEIVQQTLGYPELQKMDPNTQLMVVDEKKPGEDKFSQAAIPAILTGLYKYAQSEKGATEILQSDASVNWITKIFDDTKKDVIQTVSTYASQSGEDSLSKLNTIATEAVKAIKENLAADATENDVRAFLKNQKNNILLYLPAALNMGELLHDNTLDDETNKMEGPVSSLIRNIGDTFSGSANSESDHGLKKELSEKAKYNLN
jgi:hypothetical protein